MNNSTMEKTTLYKNTTKVLTAVNTSYTDTALSILTITLSAPSGGSGGKSNTAQCFYWDLLVRILLNTILAVLGIIGNR